MADIPVPQARKGILERNKWILFVFTSCLMVFTTLWLMFVHVNQEGLLYPHEKSLKRIPANWLHRALLYNSYNAKKVNFSENFAAPSNGAQEKNSDEFRLVCYYNFPEENQLKRLPPAKLEPDLCTHLNLAFGAVVNGSVSLSDKEMDVARELMNLRLNNSGLKILLSIGGAGDGGGFAEMIENHENRKNFIKSILLLIKDGFDGIDLDWEFPQSVDHQRMHFTQLLHEIRNEINRKRDYKKFLLTVAVAAPVFIVDSAYDVGYMNEYVDFVNVMSYDYHFYTKLTPFTGINSPLYAPENVGGYLATLNINYTTHYWLHKGMDRRKIVIGLPTYVHSFRLVNPINNGITAPANGYGSLGRNGFASYSDLCLFLNKNQIAPIFDMATKSPYATRNHEWISFDDVQSVAYKTEFIRSNNLGGAMVYALNTDDHLGYCNSKERFPLTRKIRDTLFDL